MDLTVSTETIIAIIDKVLSEAPLKAAATNIIKRKADDSGSIDKLTELVSYDEFFRTYLLHNQPCLIDSFLTELWRSSQEWKVSDPSSSSGGGSGMKPSLEAILNVVGDSPVPVANCR